MLQNNEKTADLVYLMSDPDREGFVISWSLVKFLKLPKGREDCGAGKGKACRS